MSNKVKELVILSGKGGTGKTSITSSFATLAKGDIVLVDADVDGSNLHIISSGEKLWSEDFYAGHLPFIEDEKCSRCNACKEACEYDAIAIDESGAYVVQNLLCEGCSLCTRVCPSDAIQFNDRLVGKVSEINTRFAPLVSAQLFPPGENSGKLVSEVRKVGQTLAQKYGKNLVLIDGPPGIGCPTIASLTGAQKVLIVVEASLSGFHDMQRLVTLIKSFSIPTYVCVNKSDINIEITNKIISFVNESNMTFLGTIVYDEQVGKALEVNKSVCEGFDGPAKEQIESIWNNLWES